MAEALLSNSLGDLSDVIVESAGIGALVGYPASEFSTELMAERGIDITAHRARQIDTDMISAADLVLIMESRHKKVIDEIDPTARGKIYRLGEWQEFDIPDPHRKPREAFEDALALIEKGVGDWAEKIKVSDRK